jgi:hypothetical protein
MSAFTQRWLLLLGAAYIVTMLAGTLELDRYTARCENFVLVVSAV